MLQRVSIVRALAVAGVVLACDDSLGPREVAGTYSLISVSGQLVPTAGPESVLSGVIELSASGAVVRRIRYTSGDSPAELEYVLSGIFDVQGDSIVMRVTVPSNPPVVVRLAAARQGATLILRSGSPNDGPDIVEVYRRM